MPEQTAAAGFGVVTCLDPEALHEHLLDLNYSQGVEPDRSGYDGVGRPVIVWLDEVGGDDTQPCAIVLGGEDAAHPEPLRRELPQLAYPVTLVTPRSARA